MRIALPHLRRSAALVAASLSLVLVAGCGGDSSTNPNNDAIEGTYSLKSINGLPLPFTIQSGTTSITLTKDVLTVASNGSWTESISYSQTVNGQTSTGTDDDGGSWTRAGSSVNFFSNVTNTTAYAGTYSNGTLNFTDAGFTQVFQR
jgi:hypothetical protein